MIKSELEIRRELRAVRKRLAVERDVQLYGAQQALGWVLNELRSPSEVHDLIDYIAERMT